MAYVVRETVLDKMSRKEKFVEVYSNNIDTSVCLSIQCQEREDKDISGNNGWMTSWKDGVMLTELLWLPEACSADRTEGLPMKSPMLIKRDCALT